MDSTRDLLTPEERERGCKTTGGHTPYPLSEAFFFVRISHPKRLHDAFVAENREHGNDLVMTVDLDDDWCECTYAMPTPWSRVPLTEALVDTIATAAVNGKCSAILSEPVR